MIQGFTAAASEKAAAMIQSNKGYISESLNIFVDVWVHHQRWSRSLRDEIPYQTPS